MSYKRVLKKTGKILLYILGSVLVLLCLLLLFINLPFGKRIVKNQVQSYLQDKLKTKVTIGSIDYSLPTWIEINNIYLEDQKKDTLIYGERIKADIDMISLIRGNTNIHELIFKTILINVNRAETDSTFNYQFVLDAFTGNKPTTQVDRDTAEMKLSMDKLLLDNVQLRFNDKNGGTDFFAGIKNLKASLNKFSPDRIRFGIDDFSASGVDFFMTSYNPAKTDTVKTKVVDTVTNQAYSLFITAGKFNIRDVNVKVENKISGMYYSNRVAHLGLDNIIFDMGKKTATGDAILLDSSFVQFINPQTIKDANKVVSKTASAPWYIKAKQVSMNQNQFVYDDNNVAVAEGFNAGHFNAKNISANIAALLYSKDSTTAFVKQFTFIDTSGLQLDTTKVNLLMTSAGISAKELYVKTRESLIQNAVEIKFDSFAGITKAPQNTLLNATLINTTIAFNDLYLINPALKKSFPPESFQDNSVRFNTEIRGNLQRIYLPSLQLVALSGSSVNAHGTLYNLTESDKFYYDLFIDQSSFRKEDILKFVPIGSQASMSKLPDLIYLKGQLTGNKENLVSDIEVSGKDILINGKFSLKNISKPDKLKYDFAIRKSSFDKNFIIGFVPPGTIPPEINLPQTVTAAGSFNGDANNFVADLKLGGSYGPLAVKGYMKNLKDTAHVNYDLVVSTPGFEIGKLIKQDTVLGKIAGTFKAKGTGFNYKTMTADIAASIKELQFNKYNYQNAEITAKLNDGMINTKGSVNDSSLQLQYDLAINVRNDHPSVNGTVHIDTAQLKKLNFYKDTLNFSLDANIAANDLKSRQLDINTVLDSIKLQLGQHFYSIDSVSLIAISANGADSIDFYAPFASLQAAGAFDYDKVGTSILNYVNHYYKIPGYTDSLKNIPDQQLSFNGVIKNSPIITDLVPGLTTYEDISFKGNYVSANADSGLSFNVKMPRIVYTTNTISNAGINIASANEKLNYEIGFDTLRTNGNILYTTSVKGAAANDSISLTARTEDNARKDWFALSGTAAITGDTYYFRMQDTLLLNYEQWNVNKDNYISYSPKGIIANNFILTSDTATISIKSQQPVANSPIDINIDNFNLKSITSLINQDTVFIGGIMDVKGTVSELDRSVPGFTGEASISNLAYKQNLLGNLAASAKKEADNSIVAKIDLSGNGNDIAANGNYYLSNVDKEFDVKVELKKLNFKTIEAVSEGQISRSSGNITGEIKASGKFADPRWNGQLNFDTTIFTITQFGTPYKIDKQKIVFDYPKINFPEFVIKDSLDHPLKLDGNISMRSMEDIGLNMDINTNDFIFINAKKAVNSQLYGYGSIDVNVSVTGTAESPNIDGDVVLNDKSDITLVLPEASYAKNDGKTIVRFIDRDTFDINPPVIGFTEAEKPTASFGKYLNYNLNIEVSKGAALTILVDPVTGDELKVQGDAKLNAGVDPGGNIVLAGVYELDKGYYDLHYQFLQRKFNLIKGSTITFAGTPLNSTVDITAEYIANTNSRDLLSSEVSDVNPVLANSFNQKLPFRVVLKLSGKLSKPDITFDIQLPEQSNSLLSNDLRTTIENKLQQIRTDPSSINKQVFALLLLGRFVGEQSSDFFKGNGGDFSSLARQSVSQFLSSALNQIAGDLFKGIDIDLNLNSYNDFSNGGNTERTDLNIAVSKNFANDRLTVSVGQNFGIEGQDATAKAAGASSGFKPDITISYKLSKDGKYLLRAYTKNQFEVTVDGYVMETGVAFLVTMDYDKFNELFRKNKKKK